MIIRNLPELGRFLLHGDIHGEVPKGVGVAVEHDMCDCCGSFRRVTYTVNGVIVASAETHFGTFQRTYAGALMLWHMLRETERELSLGLI